MKGFLTTKQTAERLGVSDARVRQMIRDGVIGQAEKIGRDHLIAEAEVRRLERTIRPPGRPRKS